MPGKHEGRGYSVREIIAWRFGQRGEGESTAEAQRRQAIAKADLAELVRDEKRVSVISIDEHTRQKRNLARVFVGILERAGPELSTLVAGRTPSECRAKIEAYMMARRAELAGDK